MVDEKRIVEVNGIKLEIDMRYATKIENFKIGDAVKVLQKEYSDYRVFPGVIVGFEAFKEVPTIVVAYLDISYSKAELKFVYINSKNTAVEIVPSEPLDMAMERADVFSAFEKEITAKEREIEDVKRKRKYFEKNFNMYFSEFDDVKQSVSDANLIEGE